MVQFRFLDEGVCGDYQCLSHHYILGVGGGRQSLSSSQAFKLRTVLKGLHLEKYIWVGPHLYLHLI